MPITQGPGQGSDQFGTNLQKMFTNVRDRYYRKPAPQPGAQIYFPAVSDGKTSMEQTTTRGMLIPQMAITDEQEFTSKAILFQFNPEEIVYEKRNRFANHERLGYSYDIPFWVNGGARTISFKLTLDGTAGSMFKNMAVTSGKNSYRNDNNIPNSAYVNTGDYTNSADGNGNGLLAVIAKYEALMYPMTKDNTDLVKFIWGRADVGTLDQFSNPPYVLFTYGDVSVNCFVTNIGRRDILFNRRLNPIRTELEITLEVIEAKALDKQFVANKLRTAVQGITTTNF